MPELPEVETVMRALEPALTGRTVVGVDQRRPDLRVPFPENLAGKLKDQRIESFSRRAKYILARLSGGSVLVLHLGMSGRVLLLPSGKEYKEKKHDHLILSFDDGSRFVFNDPRRFGMVLLVEEGELEEHKSFASLGLEPLSNNFGGPTLYNALKSRKCSVKDAIMNQQIVVGVGNIYACESLFSAGISPKRVANKVTQNESEKLVATIKKVLQDAIQSGGSTLKDYRHPDDNLGYFQHAFQVYGRENEKCFFCDEEIKRITQAGRSTFFCKVCQK